MCLLKRNFRVVIGIIIGVVISGVIAYAIESIPSEDVSYDITNSSENGATKETVQQALDELYGLAKECNTSCTENENIFRYYQIPATEVTAITETDSTKTQKGSTQTITGWTTATLGCSDGISSSACFGNFQEGKWRRMSYTKSRKYDGEWYYDYYRTRFELQLPSDIEIKKSAVYTIKLSGNYADTSENKENFGFRINGGAYVPTINCTADSSKIKYSTVTGSYYYDSSNSAISGGYVWISCSLNRTTNKLTLTVENDIDGDPKDGKNSGYSIRTRSDRFYMSGVLYYN